METSIITRYGKKPLIALALLAVAAVASGNPALQGALQVIKETLPKVMELASEYAESNETLTTALAAAMALAGALYAAKRKGWILKEESNFSYSYKPKKRDAKVGELESQRSSFTTYAEPGYVKSTLQKVLNELKADQGDPAIWVSYHGRPIAYSRVMGKEKTNHTLQIYGEKSQVQALTDRINGEISLARLDGSITELQETNNAPAVTTLNWVTQTETPTPIQAASKGSSLSKYLGGLSILGVIIAALLLFQKTQGSGQANPSNDKALKLARDYAQQKTGRSAKLQGERPVAEGWEFAFEDYCVTVSRDGAVRGFRAVSPPAARAI